MDTSYTLRQLSTATEREALSIEQLLVLLYGEPHPQVTPASIEELAARGVVLFVAERGEEIVATLSLVRYDTFAGAKFWIEDVVCAPEVRGRGVGRALVRAAKEWVRGCCPEAPIYLTSRPSRTAARELYRSEGFEECPTTLFRYQAND